MSHLARRWRFSDGAALAVLVAIAVLAAWPSWVEIFEVAWTDPENSHILLAGPVVVLLAYLRRGRLRYAKPEHSWWGPGIVAVSAGLFWFGSLNGYEVFEHLAALGFVLGAVVAVLGLRLVMLFKPSLIAMLFFLPVPGRLRQEIALYLQEWSARIVEVMLDLFGVQVLRAGNSLTVNGVEVAIAEACNGMRMVSALAIVTIAFVFSVPMRREVRLLFLAASPVIALVVNVIRLVPTVLMYGYRSADAADTFHDMSGWGVLVVAIGLLYGMLALLRWLEVPISPYPVRTA